MQRSLVLISLIVLASMEVRAVDLTIDGSRKFQTMDGFGVNINVASWNNGELRPALDMLVDDLGAAIFRVIIDNADWESTNDNSNPAVFNWTYYNGVYGSAKFQELWSTIAYLNQKGITSGIMLNFMGRVPDWMGLTHIDQAAEDEWVEMIASLVHYGRNNRGLQFSLLAPMNEPDWDGIEGPQVGSSQYVTLLRKLAQRLDAEGLGQIRLVGPDTAAIFGGVSNYMPEMMADSVVMAKVDHFAFHNYAGESGGADAAIKGSAYPDRNFWITEVTNSWDIMTHLSQGPAAVLVWDAYDSVYNHALVRDPSNDEPPNDVGNGPPLIDYDTSSGTYTPRKGFYEAAQIFKFVRPGFVRIAAVESSSALTVYAFHDASAGFLTIVGRNEGGSALTINGQLENVQASGPFRLYRTDGSRDMEQGPDVPVSGGAFTTQAPAGGFFTLTNAVATPPPPVDTVPPAAPTNLRVIQVQ